MYRFNRPACTNVFILGAALYLLMLAKNYTTDGSVEMQNFFIMIMCMTYLGLMYNICNNCSIIIAKLKAIENSDDVVELTLAAIQLKLKTMRGFRNAIAIYYLSNITHEITSMLFLNSNNDN